MTEEDLQLIELYGPKIRSVIWYFENDKIIQEKLSQKVNKEGFGGLLAQFGDESDYDNEDEEEEEEKGYEIFNGTGFSMFDNDNCTNIE